MRLIANALWRAGNFGLSALCTLAFVVAGLGFAPLAASAQINLPPASVYARAYGGWNLIGQTANTFTFNGGVCSYAPQNNGNSPNFFVFSGSQAGTTVYFPVQIIDANPSLSEIVTPTSTTQSSASCGFAASTTNSHTTFTLTSGTGGLQEAVASAPQGQPTWNVLLDPYWYQTVFGLPGLPLPEVIIKATTGNTGVQIVDTTTTPWTYWRWSGTAYAATSLSGGSAAPTAAAGAAAGTSPTGPTNTGDGNSLSVALTTGTATTTGTLFTETWATSAAFLYPPVCRVWETGANSVAVTTAVTYPSGTHALLTISVASAPPTATAYTFKISCS